MNLKKVSLRQCAWDLFYVEGEVTAADVKIVRDMEKVSRYESAFKDGAIENYVTSKVEVVLDPEIVSMLDLHSVWREETPGLRRLVQHDRCKSDDPSKVKAMMTKHRAMCESKFSEEAVQRQIDWLVEAANRDIARMKDKFRDTVSQIMGADDGWTFDSQDRIDEIQREIDELEAVISVKEKARNAIIAKEMEEWLEGELDDKELRVEIMERAGFGKDHVAAGRRKRLRRH